MIVVVRACCAAGSRTERGARLRKVVCSSCSFAVFSWCLFFFVFCLLLCFMLFLCVCLFCAVFIVAVVVFVCLGWWPWKRDRASCSPEARPVLTQRRSVPRSLGSSFPCDCNPPSRNELFSVSPVKPPRSQTLRSPRPRVTSALTRLSVVVQSVSAVFRFSFCRFAVLALRSLFGSIVY